MGVRGDRGGGGVGAVGRGAGKIGAGPAALVDTLEEPGGVFSDIRGGHWQEHSVSSMYPRRLDSIQ